jgi:hypothetical protein
MVMLLLPMIISLLLSDLILVGLDNLLHSGLSGYVGLPPIRFLQNVAYANTRIIRIICIRLQVRALSVSVSGYVSRLRQPYVHALW